MRVLSARAEGLLSGFVAGLAFGTAAIFIRLISLNALTIVTWRLIIGGLLLILLIKDSRKIAKNYISIPFILGTILFFHFFFFVKSVQDTLIMNSTIIVNSAPLISLIISYSLKIEKHDFIDGLTVVIGFLGILIMSFKKIVFTSIWIGEIEALLAAIMISIYAIFARQKIKDRMVPLAMAGWIYLIAGLEAFIIAVSIGRFELPTYNDFLYILLLALIPTMIGHSLYLHSLKGLAPHETQILALLEPIVATVLGVILFYEIPPILSITGGSLVVISILMLSLRTKIVENEQIVD